MIKLHRDRKRQKLGTWELLVIFDFHAKSQALASFSFFSFFFLNFFSSLALLINTFGLKDQIQMSQMEEQRAENSLSELEYSG